MNIKMNIFIKKKKNFSLMTVQKYNMKKMNIKLIQ